MSVIELHERKRHRGEEKNEMMRRPDCPEIHVATGIAAW
jgi:hypothetical protein